ncbi:hypothetical protein EVAR_36373_1 [Eumeta japonica]|uniref:Uncharacterized protein n=1 Tax=Eumeta variegata TaxID=151549 RepID=A0A4C1W768_EUMVA|nr:hypothetical protein EVAR_36373_1 [Eumeta japonica]
MLPKSDRMPTRIRYRLVRPYCLSGYSYGVTRVCGRRKYMRSLQWRGRMFQNNRCDVSPDTCVTSRRSRRTPVSGAHSPRSITNFMRSPRSMIASTRPKQNIT